MIIKRLKDGVGMLVMQPNLSGNRVNNTIAMLIALLASMFASLPLAFVGLWAPMLFSLACLAFLGLALARTYASLQRRQVVHLNPGSVIVKEGKYAPETHWERPRAWVRMEVANLESMTRLPEIRLACSSESIRLGHFLGERELKRLIVILRKHLRVNPYQIAQ